MLCMQRIDHSMFAFTVVFGSRTFTYLTDKIMQSRDECDDHDNEIIITSNNDDNDMISMSDI